MTGNKRCMDSLPNRYGQRYFARLIKQCQYTRESSLGRFHSNNVGTARKLRSIESGRIFPLRSNGIFKNSDSASQHVIDQQPNVTFSMQAVVDRHGRVKGVGIRADQLSDRGRFRNR